MTFNRNMDSVLGARSSGKNDTYAAPSKVAKLRAKRTSLINQYAAQAEQAEQAKDKPAPTKAAPQKEIKQTTTTINKQHTKSSSFITPKPHATGAIMDVLVIASFILLMMFTITS